MNAIFCVGGKAVVTHFAELGNVQAAASALLESGTLPAGAELVATNIQLPDDFAQHAWLWVNGSLVKDQSRASERIAAEFTGAIQKRLDSFAQQRNYDSILSACTYATSTVAKFKTEGQACVNLRDATWAAAYTILAEVQAGDRPMPASIADIEADLPAAVWPV
jgi:hypothetical protein